MLESHKAADDAYRAMQLVFETDPPPYRIEELALFATVIAFLLGVLIFNSTLLVSLYILYLWVIN